MWIAGSGQETFGGAHDPNSKKVRGLLDHKSLTNPLCLGHNLDTIAVLWFPAPAWPVIANHILYFVRRHSPCRCVPWPGIGPDECGRGRWPLAFRLPPPNDTPILHVVCSFPRDETATNKCEADDCFLRRPESPTRLALGPLSAIWSPLSYLGSGRQARTDKSP